MFEDDVNQPNANTEAVKPAKRADILQDTFKHYSTMATDHHTKAGTTSQILLAIVAAIVALISADKNLGGSVDLVGGLAVYSIGLFGAAWVWKQHERYHFWSYIARQYQQELTQIVPTLKMGRDYYASATEATARDFGSLFAKKVLDRYLWVSLHVLVALGGFLLILGTGGLWVAVGAILIAALFARVVVWLSVKSANREGEIE